MFDLRGPTLGGLHRAAKVIAAILIIIIVIILALLLHTSGTSGTLSCFKPQETKYGGDPEQRRAKPYTHTPGPLEIARFNYLKEKAQKPPPQRFEKLNSTYGGGQKKSSSKVPPPKKHWTKYKTWEKLRNDRGAWHQYIDDKFEAMTVLDHDWTDVMKVIRPKLTEDREYIGLINRVRGTKKMKIIKLEASPSKVGESSRAGLVAEVPVELVEKICKQPALFEFHTHPIGYGGSPLPSDIDMFGAFVLGLHAEYAASLVIGKYGIIMYTPNSSVLNRIWDSENPRLTMLRQGYDLVTAFQGKRSWADWKLDDFRDMCTRYQLLYVVYPTPIYIYDNLEATFTKESAITDRELIEDLQKNIAELEQEETKKID